jgi:predicted component of type VI protein secretion system
MEANFRLVMRTGPTVGKVFPLDKNELFLGRDLSNDLVINDPEISRRHSRLYLQGNGYIIEDLGSTNGTFVNGQRLMGPNMLRPGDLVTFGERMSLVYEASDFDQDATMVSPAARPAFDDPDPVQVYPAPPPAYNNPPQPAYNNPPPAYTPPQPGAYPQQNYPPQTYPPQSYPPGAPAPQGAESYAGQVPQGYAPEIPPQPRSPVMWISIAVILLLACVCVSAFLWFAPREFWCALPIDWAAYGGTCP